MREREKRGRKTDERERYRRRKKGERENQKSNNVTFLLSVGRQVSVCGS